MTELCLLFQKYFVIDARIVIFVTRKTGKASVEKANMFVLLLSTSPVFTSSFNGVYRGRKEFVLVLKTGTTRRTVFVVTLKKED